METTDEKRFNTADKAKISTDRLVTVEAELSIQLREANRGSLAMISLALHCSAWTTNLPLQ
jgi:hypothetical protein